MAYRSSSQNNGNTTTPNTTVPAGVAAGDIIILSVGGDNVGWVFNGTWPAGFSHLAEVGVTADGHKAGVAWKRATGADSGSYTCSAQSGASEWIMDAFVFSGRHATNPPVISTNNTSNSANASPVTVTANGVTAIAGDDLLWIAVQDVVSTNAGSYTPPSGYTEREDSTALGGWVYASGATKENVTAGATGTVSGTWTGATASGWAAWTVRIPAAPTALGITSLYQVGSSTITTAGTGKTSSAFTPPANSKLTIAAFGESSSGVATFTPTDSVGLSWTQVDHAQFAGGFFPRITVWEASIGSSPVSMTVTITPTVWNSEIAYAVYAVTGVNPRRKSGQDAAAVAQAGATYQSGTLPAAATNGNLSVFVLGINTDAFTTPPTPSGWTNLAKIAAGGGTYEKVGVSYRTDFTGTSANVASTGENLAWGVALIEYEETPTGPTIGLIVNSLTLSTQDQIVSNLLTGAGYTVTPILSTSSLVDGVYNAYVITESGAATSAAITSIPTSTTPVLLMETSVNTMRLATAGAIASSEISTQQYDILANSHAIVTDSGVSDPVTIYPTNQSMYSVDTSQVASGAVKIARVVSTGTNDITMIAAEIGSTLTTGSAPARRVWYGAGVGGTSVSNWQTGANALFLSAVEWLTLPPVYPGEFGYGYWLLEDGSGRWELEANTDDWLLDTTESAPVVVIARVRGPIINNVALNRSHTR